MNRAVIAGLLLAVVAALALRLPALGGRPMHHDEAVNALKFRPLLEHGGYRYDPEEFHGPTLPWFTLAWIKLSGDSDFAKISEARLRGLSVLFGIGLLLLLPLVTDGLGRAATVFTGMLTAVSPVMVYYNRDYIHESALVFFTFLALAAGWRWYRSRNIFWAVLAGAAVGLMQATKETFVLALAAAAVAIIANGRWIRAENANRFSTGKNFKPVAFACMTWLAVAVLFFTSFFTNAAGFLDSVKAFLPALHRAAGNSPHLHPWNFYLERLLFFHVANGPVWSEGFVLVLAWIGCCVAFAGRPAAAAQPDFLRFVAIYTLALTFTYCAIAYKTPWCVLGFWHGAILLAGAGAAALLRRAKRPATKIVAVIFLISGPAHLAAQAWRAAVPFNADRRNPWVYAQTSPDILELAGKVDDLARLDPRHAALPVQVIAPADNYWPLPWYFRALNQASYCSEIPGTAAPVVIASVKLEPKFNAPDHTAAGIFELRPGAFVELFVETNLWNALLRANDDSKK